jgi:hypothetical protein
MSEVQRRRMRIPRRAVLIVAVFLILLAEVGHAQLSAGRFRIDARVGQSKKGTPVYSGYIYNDVEAAGQIYGCSSRHSTPRAR